MRSVAIEVDDARLEATVHGEQGPLVVACHGFPDGPSTWRAQVPALVEAGFRVVTPWMRGYAPSGRGGSYDVTRLGRDVLAWAEHLSPWEPVSVLGHDWGAIAAYAAAGLEPARIRRLVSLAVPHFGALFPHALRRAQVQRSWYILFFQTPRWPEVALARPDGALVRRLWREWSPGYTLPRDEADAIITSIRAQPSAVLGPYRALWSALARRAPVWRKVAAPSLYIHGVDDGCLGAELVDGVERGFEQVSVHRLPGGHWVHLESPGAVTELTVAHLTSAYGA